MMKVDEKVKIRGRVSVVARTKGIKLEDHAGWYNPTDSCKAYVNFGLKGKMVELTMEDDGVFSFIKAVESDTPSQVAVSHERVVDMPQKESLSKDGYWALKDKRDLIKQEQIRRAGALNTAVEILKRFKAQETVVSELTVALQLAERIVDYIDKGYSSVNDLGGDLN